MSPKSLSEKDLIRVGVGIARTICGWCNLSLRTSLKQMSIQELDYKDPNNVTRALDGIAHNYAVLTLKEEFGDRITIWGEEARTPEVLRRTNRTVAIVDAIDGTDLVARGFANWCSAFVFFNPKQAKIIAAVVGHSSGEVYYASSEGAAKRTVNAGRGQKLKRNPEEQLRLEQASVCFYGQKPHNLLTVTDDKDSAGFQKMLNEFRYRMREKKEKLPFRLYNFGGNPMMVKIPERTVDAVFELSGQKPHDVIPGAYIATQGGAVLTDLEGRPINLAEALLTPNKKLKYILAATNSLSIELQWLLKTPEKPAAVPIQQTTTEASISAAKS